MLSEWLDDDDDDDDDDDGDDDIIIKMQPFKKKINLATCLEKRTCHYFIRLKDTKAHD